jgi:hypothetical protein
MNQNNLNKDNTIIWLTGHSRGGAVSAILAAYLINEGFTIHSYNFAAPNQVEFHSTSQASLYTMKNPTSYKGIYNIVNSEDLVPYLPMTENWGFTKYGETLEPLQFSDVEKNSWTIKAIEPEIFDTSDKYDKSDWFIFIGDTTLETTLEKFGGISKTRNGCYINDGNSEKELSTDQLKFLYLLIVKYPSLIEYIDDSDIVNPIIGGDRLHQRPILFMQILSIVTAGDTVAQVSFIGGQYSSPFYWISGFSMLAFSLGTDFMNPHFADSYIILVENKSVK